MDTTDPPEDSDDLPKSKAQVIPACKGPHLDGTLTLYQEIKMPERFHFLLDTPKLKFAGVAMTGTPITIDNLAEQIADLIAAIDNMYYAKLMETTPNGSIH